MNKILLLIIVMIGLGINNVSAKKLEIHRCVKQNGTIAFQEKKCDKTQSIKLKSTQKQSPVTLKINTKKKNKSNVLPKYSKPAPVNYQRIANVSVNDQSTQLISDNVKSYNISLFGLKKWGLFKKVYNNKLLHIKFLDQNSDGDMSLLIDFIFPDNKNFSLDELTELVYLVGSRFANESREGAVIPEKMNISNGKGMMATFTDSSINSNFRYTTKGAVFKGKWLIQFTLLSMNRNSYSHQYALQSLFDSIRITNKKN